MSRYLVTVEKIEQAAFDEIDKVATKVREELLIPFCNRTGFRFLVIQGNWLFDWPTPRRTVLAKNAQSMYDWQISIPGARKNGENDFLPGRPPRALIEFMKQEHPLRPSMSLGDLMESYTPPGWKPPVP